MRAKLERLKLMAKALPAGQAAVVDLVIDLVESMIREIEALKREEEVD